MKPIWVKRMFGEEILFYVIVREPLPSETPADDVHRYFSAEAIANVEQGERSQLSLKPGDQRYVQARIRL